MNSSPFKMRLLLAAAGFSIRGATRADCIHCEGHSRGTVAFTSEVAFCHRCKWRANVVMLARDARLLRSDSQQMAAIRDEMRRRAQMESLIKRFERWREVRLRSVSDRYLYLSRAAIRASEVLTKFPDCEPAWSALAEFYHAQSRLSAIFEWLMFTKASDWLEADSTAVEVFQTWRHYAA